MKTLMRFRFVAAVVLLALLCFVFTGCASLKGQGGPFIETEEVIQGTIIAPDGTVQSVPLTNTVTKVNPAWTEALTAAQQVNSLANPTPSAPLVNLGITAVIGILGGIAAWKNKKNARVADLLIAGIETANNPVVKDTIRQLSMDKGLADVVRRRVEKVTGK